MNKVKRCIIIIFAGEYFGKLKLLVEESYKKEGRKVVLVKWQLVQMQKILKMSSFR